MATLGPAHATSALTPPHSSHGRGLESWESEHMQEKAALASEYDSSHLSASNDIDPFARKPSPIATSFRQDKENGLRSPIMVDDGTFGEIRPAAASRAQSRASERRSRERTTNNEPTTAASGQAGPTEADKWIHRDKLAKIENAELQAAGFVLPKPRAASRRRERSEHGHRSASRKNSMNAESRPTDIDTPEWGDLRLPEEIQEETDANYWESPLLNGKGSRIPVAKLSPVPIPIDVIDRDAPIGRSKSFEPDLEPRKPRSRSGSTKTNPEPYQTSSSMPPTTRRGVGESPRKVSATRKSSVPPRRSSSRPKTRGNRDSIGTQNSGRSADYASPSSAAPGTSNKQVEGDPPWMISAYKPDPRLPPEEQLLPTVAKRLQQERWEKEGKFGNVYDKDFRPLNDEGFLQPPEPTVPAVETEGGSGDQDGDGSGKGEPEWPLRSTDIPRSPTVRSYSTMPKISDKPPGSPLPSPRIGGPTMSRPGTAQSRRADDQPAMQPPIDAVNLERQQTLQQQQQQQQQTELEKDKDGGCGCCIIM